MSDTLLNALLRAASAVQTAQNADMDGHAADSGEEALQEAAWEEKHAARLLREAAADLERLATDYQRRAVRHETLAAGDEMKRLPKETA